MTPIDDFMTSAQRSLDMTMYELSDPTAEQILVADHDKGVRVRVLLGICDFSGGSVNQAAYSTLSADGVSVAWANDSEIFHQKTITVDGSGSAIMTGNLTSRYYATTRDFVVMDRQPADVAAIKQTFLRLGGGAPSPGPAGGDLVWSPGSEPQLTVVISTVIHVVVENEEMGLGSGGGRPGGRRPAGSETTVTMTSDRHRNSVFRLDAAGSPRARSLPEMASAL